MTMYAKTTTFRILSSQTVGATIDVDFGFQPSFVKAVWNTVDASSSPVDSSSLATSCYGVGFGASSTNRCSYQALSQHNVTTTVEWERSSLVAFVQVINTAGSIVGALDIDVTANWPATGIRLIVDTQFTDNMTVIVTGISGSGADQITNVLCSGSQTRQSTGTQDYAQGTFEPDAIFITMGSNSGVPGGSGGDSPLTLGFARQLAGAGGSIDQIVVGAAANETATTTLSRRYFRSGECLLGYNSGITTTSFVADYRGRVTGGGFTLNWSDAAASDWHWLFAMIQGGSWHIASGSTSTTPNATISFTSAPFKPAAGFILSPASGSQNATQTPVGSATTTFGHFSSTTDRYSVSRYNEDGVTTSIVGRSFNVDGVYQSLNNDASTQGSMDVDAILSNGVRFIMDEADDGANEFAVILVGPAAGDAEIITFPSQLHTQAILIGLDW